MGFAVPALAALASTALGKIAINIGVSLVLSAVSKKLSKPPSFKPSDLNTGLRDRKTSIRQSVAPQELVYGKSRKGGLICFFSSDPANRNRLDMVIILAAHVSKSIGAIYFNGELAIPAGEDRSTGRYEGKALVKRKTADVAGQPFPDLQARYPNLWTNRHKCQGLTAIYIRIRNDANVFPTGLPNVSADIEGLDSIYDPRDDSYGYTRNSALCIAHYMTLPKPRGLGMNYGTDIRTDLLIAAANVCDETPSGTTEARYSCDGVVQLESETTPQTHIEAMLTSMAGEIYWDGQSFRMYAGAWRAPEVSLGDGDAAPGGFKLQTRQGISSNYNGVRGQFVSPDNDWQPDDYPPYQSSVYVSEDNGQEAWEEHHLPYTISSNAAQRLAKIKLEEQRRQQTVVMAGRFARVWKVNAGEVINLTRERYGFDEKPFLVKRNTLTLKSSVLTNSLFLRETSPLVYSWDASEEQVYNAAPRSELPSPFDVFPPGILSVEEGLYVTRAGDVVKAELTVQLSESNSQSPEYYILESRVDGGEWVRINTGNSDELSYRILDVVPGLWEIRASTVTNLGVRSVPSDVYSLRVDGLTATPQTLSGLSLQSNGGLALLKWGLSPDADVRIGGQILIRHSAFDIPQWNLSSPLVKVPGSSTLAVAPLIEGSYMVRAQDSSGQLGPVQTVYSNAASAIPFTEIDFLQEDDEFSGEKTNVYPVAGGIRLAFMDDFYDSENLYAEADLWNIGDKDLFPSGEYRFTTGLDFGTVKTVKLVRDMLVSAFRTEDDLFSEPDLWAIPDLYQSVATEVDCMFEIQTSLSAGSVEEDFGDWQELDVADVRARSIRARLLLSTPNGRVTPVVSRLRLKAQEFSTS
jgi:hypothetical protein